MSHQSERTVGGNHDVPVADLMGICMNSTSDGTTMNPPPTPRKPARNPTAAPAITTGQMFRASVDLGRAVQRCASGRQSRTPGGGSIAESVRKCSRLESRLSLLSFVIGFSRAQPQASKCSALFSFTNRIVIWTSVIFWATLECRAAAHGDRLVRNRPCRRTQEGRDTLR
jgi:hypothetical protein